MSLSVACKQLYGLQNRACHILGFLNAIDVETQMRVYVSMLKIALGGARGFVFSISGRMVISARRFGCDRERCFLFISPLTVSHTRRKTLKHGER